MCDFIDQMREGFSVFAITDVGSVRTNNEDNFCCNGVFKKEVSLDHFEHKGAYPREGHLLIAVFDGMGGESGGEYAALAAAQGLSRYYVERGRSGSPFAGGEIIQAINRSVCEGQGGRYRRMGCTAVIVACYEGHFQFINVGDSRGYLCRNGRLSQMTYDHTERNSFQDFQREMGLEIDMDPDMGMDALTQYLGVAEEDFELEPFLSEDQEIEKGDIFLLCSDGLTNMVPHDEAEEILGSSKSLDEKASLLIARALEHGGKDNVTVVLAEWGKKLQ